MAKKRSIFNKDEHGKTKVTWDALPRAMVLDQELSNDAFRLAAVLTSCINVEKNGDERSFPSFKEIRRIFGWKNDKIGKVIDELVAVGWIKDIVSTKEFNFQNNYYLNDSKKINKKLLEKRTAKHEKQSIKTKERIAKKKAEIGSPESETALPSPEIRTTVVPQQGLDVVPKTGTRNKELIKQELNKQDSVDSSISFDLSISSDINSEKDTSRAALSYSDEPATVQQDESSTSGESNENATETSTSSPIYVRELKNIFEDEPVETTISDGTMLTLHEKLAEAKQEGNKSKIKFYSGRIEKHNKMLQHQSA